MLQTIEKEEPALLNKDEKMIEVANLKVLFGSQEVLSDVTFDLFKQENLIVLGKSGSGKSVLIKCIVGLIHPDDGSIKVNGNEVTRMRRQEMNDFRRKIGFLFQSAALYDSMSVKENLRFPLKRMKTKLTEKEINERIESVLENVGLADAKDKMPSQLSGGMRKRIGLARTLIPGPAIMLYDEPTTGLDPVTSNEISELINKIQQTYQTSSIIITHDISCARTTGNRVIMLNEGKIYTSGSFKDLAGSDDPWIQSFFI